MELVSIIIPCFRQAHLLGEAIESVLAQSYPYFEIIVVDDGSPDDPAQVVKRYPSVLYRRQDNRGVSAARNSGTQASSGTYLVFLDADDRLLPNHLHANLKAFEEHPDAGFVCGDYRWFGAEDTWHTHDCRPSPDHYATLLRRNFIGPPHVVMFKRRIIQEVGGFRSGSRCEDQELFLRIARTYPIYCHHEIIAEYRRHDTQWSQQCDIMLRNSLRVLGRQGDYVKRNAMYREALHSGIHFRQRLYESGLIQQILMDVEKHNWQRAARALSVFARYHPRGLANALWNKLRMRISGRPSGSDRARDN
ncbi:MAG: glycosyltransferase [Nitrospiraceae bacterium]|nr:glycosyltransferase [Nitrospiraceae bacterium]